MCREKEINLELLTNAILSQWKRVNFNYKTIALNPINLLQGQSEFGFEYLY